MHNGLRVAPRRTPTVHHLFKHTSSGFTLVEVLFALSIVALLSALVFPAFAAARGKARQTTCTSNLRQIGMAFAMYAQDNDELYPYGLDVADKFTNTQQGDAAFKTQLAAMPLLPVALDVYTESREVWRCPADSGFDFLDLQQDREGNLIPLPARPTEFGKYGMSYMYRTSLTLEHARFGTFSTRKVISMDGKTYNPAQVWVLADSFGGWHGGHRFAEKRFTTLFGDGHCAVLTGDQFQDNQQMVLMP